MDVEVAMGRTNARLTVWPYWLAEGIGLVLLIYGLAASAWWTALGGVVVMVLAYAAYPRTTRRANYGDAYTPYVGYGTDHHWHHGDRRDDRNDSDNSSGDSGGDLGGDGGGDGGGGGGG
jgi:uncharacterized membrane protein YgcG